LDSGVAQQFECSDAQAHGCVGQVHVQCERVGEFIQTREVDCAAQGKVCDPEQVCLVCRPDAPARCRDCTGQGSDCNPNVIEQCRADGSGYDALDTCGGDGAVLCVGGRCGDACSVAASQNSYSGCLFFAADLDNAAIDDAKNASAQQYAVVVANGQRVPVEVQIDLNSAAFGSAAVPTQVDKKLVLPGDLEVFLLPRREVDGSTQGGVNDGTHSAVTSNAYRITSNYPITAYQFNPLENVNVFSNGASLLLPVPALGSRYTVVGWPQTIGDSKDPYEDFDPTASFEDLRAFITVIGTREQTHLHVEYGADVRQVESAPYVPAAQAGDTLDLTIGPFDVVNLETRGLNADFTGTRIDADAPVAVFSGSEASDVPMFGSYAQRQCCADHLEEQLLPDSSAGTNFVVGRMPPRARALNRAALPGAPLNVADTNEPEWIRVVNTYAGRTRVRTTLASPDDDILLEERGSAVLRADRDFTIHSDRPIHVLEAVASQDVTGIPSWYPGGDPSIIVVPPVEQFRSDYIFLTPDKYAFDFVTVVAPEGARIELDGAALSGCDETPAADALDDPSGTQTTWIVHRCQLSFPQVTRGSGSQRSRVLAGEQHDGAHSLVSDQNVSIVVYGFDSFVSYAYVGGLNLSQLN